MVSVNQVNAAFGFGTRPIEGRKPTTLQNAAGLRSEPPVSEPSATGTMPHANATAAPPDEPPGECAGFQGLRVGPNRRHSVTGNSPNSGLALLPKIKARLTARVSARLNQLEAALELCPEVKAEIQAALAAMDDTGREQAARAAAMSGYWLAELTVG